MTKVILILLISTFLIWYIMSEDLEYELVKAEVRNIIFAGKSRSGKSTLIEVLKDVNHSPKEMDILAGTQAASLATFTMESKQQNKNLHFNIMDTPGLYERQLDPKNERTNEVILDIIKKCIDLEITKIKKIKNNKKKQNKNKKHIKNFKQFNLKKYNNIKK
eukprot:333958_1